MSVLIRGRGLEVYLSTGRVTAAPSARPRQKLEGAKLGGLIPGPGDDPPWKTPRAWECSPPPIFPPREAAAKKPRRPPRRRGWVFSFVKGRWVRLAGSAQGRACLRALWLRVEAFCGCR